LPPGLSHPSLPSLPSVQNAFLPPPPTTWQSFRNLATFVKRTDRLPNDATRMVLMSSTDRATRAIWVRSLNSAISARTRPFQRQPATRHTPPSALGSFTQPRDFHCVFPFEILSIIRPEQGRHAAGNVEDGTVDAAATICCSPAVPLSQAVVAVTKLVRVRSEGKTPRCNLKSELGLRSFLTGIKHGTIWHFLALKSKNRRLPHSRFLAPSPISRDTSESGRRTARSTGTVSLLHDQPPRSVLASSPRRELMAVPLFQEK
jgi:hypothetical protein